MDYTVLDLNLLKNKEDNNSTITVEKLKNSSKKELDAMFADPKVDKLTLKAFHEMTLDQLCRFFTLYKRIKLFCKSLDHQHQEKKIFLPNSKTDLTDEDAIKKVILKYMKLPTSTNSEIDSDVERYKRFKKIKYKNLSATFTIMRDIKKIKYNIKS